MGSNSFEEGLSIISRLPVDIRIKIKDYFVSKETCDKLLSWWKDNYILRCSAKDIEDVANEILKSEEAVEYICRKNKYARPIYIEHFIDGKKYYHLMNSTCSFVTAVLMCMWH